MQNTQPQHYVFATRFGLTVGALGFLLSFALALLMLIEQGNPGFLLIWMAAVTATAACMRAHARCRKAWERMYAPEAERSFYPARKGWKHNVEDIAFRDVQDHSIAFSQ